MSEITAIFGKPDKIGLLFKQKSQSMVTKKEAIEFAKKYNWTAKDAERAYVNIALENATEQDLITALLAFAGPELLERQRLQAAQKAQVTKKKNYISKIEADFANKIEEADRQVSELRSTFLPLIAKLYNFASPFGLKDPWIEALLVTYNNFLSNQNDDEVA
ncbi:hypothetical protein [Chroococcus sp. FPU101]|uniref:hypothetical protein n=1 Tax=Chroococcus sp. FPU101 TaxID=1974212 RepID=UPI001AA47B31|nr:hypothetical protein [Chroococcus sp. FPU101]GFE71933.1 hypothetical protein CFPU101_45430 [Chroococcus sp. FPU101]